MKEVVVFLLCFHQVSLVRHSMKYFYTFSDGIPSFPEFVAVGMVDGAQMVHYDSITQAAVPKQDWLKEAALAEPQYWEGEKAIFMANQQTSKIKIDTMKQRFNQTGGVHTYQWMYGCEWDNETGDIGGYDQHGFDGEDFIALDFKTWTYVAPVPQAVITKHKWDIDRVQIEYLKHYFTQYCIEWLKKYVEQGKSVLQRTVPPSVSLLQKAPSAPVTCHATGFYPDRVIVLWRKDGEQQHEDVDIGEVLPNPDGTFQQSVHLDLSTVKPEDWTRYDCQVQLAGMEQDVVTKLDPSVIKTNWGKPGVSRGAGMKTERHLFEYQGQDLPGSPSETPSISIIIGVVVVLVFGINGIIGYFVWKKKSDGGLTLCIFSGFKPVIPSGNGSDYSPVTPTTTTLPAAVPKFKTR